MFDTMTLTKLVGGVCGALLIFLFGNWMADTIYGFGEAGHEEQVLAYTIEGAETEAATTDVAAAEPVFADLVAVADVTAGEAVFGKCKACHKVDGSNGVGPHLNGVVGRDHGAVEGFSYSAALLERKGTPWSEEEIYSFLKNPKGWLPGTKMGFAGLPNIKDRADVIAYLAATK